MYPGVFHIYILLNTPSTSIIAGCPCTASWLPLRWRAEAVRNGFSHYNTSLALRLEHTIFSSSDMILYSNSKAHSNNIHPQEDCYLKGKTITKWRNIWAFTLYAPPCICYTPYQPAIPHGLLQRIRCCEAKHWIKLLPQTSYIWLSLWHKRGARRPMAHGQHYAAPLAALKENLQVRLVLAHAA